MDDAVYKALQKHLDSLPVAFPATRSGVELRILRRLFTPDEDRLAAACGRMLEKMAQKGGIFRKALGLTYLSTPLPQMRFVPVSESVSDIHHIATYDEIRQIIAQAGWRSVSAARVRTLPGAPALRPGAASFALLSGTISIHSPAMGGSGR
jgi:hypothetical protein